MNLFYLTISHFTGTHGVYENILVSLYFDKNLLNVVLFNLV